AYAAAQTIGPALTGHERRTHFPGQALADAATRSWRNEHGAPLRYVIGPMWIAGNIGFYSPDRPSVFIDANPRISSWVEGADLQRRGGLIVWNALAEGEAMPERLAKRFPSATAQPTITLPLAHMPSSRAVRLRWALIPPEG